MKEKFYRFMQGRYGIDQLNIFLMIVCIGCFVLSLFFSSFMINVMAYGTWIIVIYRMISTNVYLRNQENEKYLKLVAPLANRLKVRLFNKQDSAHKYFICPSCKQMTRVPRGHGKVIITCPHCHNKFEKRT